MRIRDIVLRLWSSLTDRGLHVGFDAREHDTDGVDCWCSPTYFRPCDECDAGCWKCTEGRIALTRDEAAADEDPIVIVHNGTDLVP